LWPGYETSIRQYEKNILVNCDMRFKVMRQETVHDILKACISDPQKGRDNFKAQILGSIVLASYGMKRTYRVDDVDFSMTPKSTFNWKGRDISYVEYFKEQYQITIKDPNQPMLISTPKVIFIFLLF
jgi:aubergine-like protein